MKCSKIVIKSFKLCACFCQFFEIQSHLFYIIVHYHTSELIMKWCALPCVFSLVDSFACITRNKKIKDMFMFLSALPCAAFTAFRFPWGYFFFLKSHCLTKNMFRNVICLSSDPLNSKQWLIISIYILY